MALLCIGASKVEADLTPAARQACRKTLKVEVVAGFHRGVGVAERHGGRDLVNADIGRAEGGPVVVAILAKSIGGVLGLGEGAVGGGAVELGCGRERIGQLQAADDRQPFGSSRPSDRYRALAAPVVRSRARVICPRQMNTWASL